MAELRAPARSSRPLSTTPAVPPIRSASGRTGSLRHLGSLEAPGVDLACLGELTGLLAGCALPSASARPVGVTAGVWIISGGQGDAWLLKRVSAQRVTPALPTDVEHCEALLQKFPALRADARLAFPHSVISLRQGRDLVGHLLVSRVMPGQQLGAYIAMLDLKKPEDQQRLEALCKGVGSLLASFHLRYSDPETGEATNHRDFHPSNVLFDEVSGAISIVDLSGMGTWGPNDDVEKFARIMRQLAGERYSNAFEQTYSSAWKARTPRVHLAAVAVEPGLKKVPLYGDNGAPSIARAAMGLGRGEGFRHLSNLVVPASGFMPAAHLTTLAWVLSPSRQLHLTVTRAGASDGAWVLSGDRPEDRWLLKTVNAQRRMPALPTDTEHCEVLAKKFPALLTDKSLAFPHSVIPLYTDGARVTDLLVSRAVPGVTLGEYIAKLDLRAAPDQDRLEHVCRAVGALLADFHKRYADPVTHKPTYHQDFHPSNVLYDESTGAVGIVDMSGMGSWGADDDSDKFARLMRQWAGNRYADAFLAEYTLASRCRIEATAAHIICRGHMWPWCATKVDEFESDSDSDHSDIGVVNQIGRQCSIM